MHENPSLHDKIEFQVALTCVTLDREQQSARMLEAGLSDEEMRSFLKLLQDLTEGVISGTVAPISEQLGILDEMQIRRQRLLNHESESTVYLSRQVHDLLGDCERLGLVPFSVLARYAFIAMAMLRSLKDIGVFSTDEYESILRSIQTVATDLSADLVGHSEGRIDTETFLERFGHLRPSSYDITSPNYASNPELYMLNSHSTKRPVHRNQPADAAKVFEDHGKEIDRLIGEIGLSIDHRQLGDFILRAIPARESAKFEFMKNVDAALEIIAKLGERLGFDRDQVSFLTADRIFAAAVNSPTAANITQLEREIEFAKKRWNLTCVLRLPHLVKSKNDVYAFSIGIYILGSALYAILHAKQFYSYVKNTININADTPQNVRRRMITVATRVGRIAWTYTAFLFILPTLFSFLVEFYLIVPLHTYFAIEERHVMHFVQSWTLGLLYVKLTTRIILWHEDSRPAQSLRAITRNGYLDPDARLATRSFILPVGLSLCFALAYPWACATLATMTVLRDRPEKHIVAYRYAYPMCFCLCCIIYALYILLSWVKDWRMKIRDEVYLIGERLHNFGDRKSSGSGVSVPNVRRIET
mgnify:CR=1 FL=1